MARTVAEIKQVIIDEKNAQAALNGLNSTSQTAIWNLWAYIIAVFTYVHETLWDQFQAQVNATVAALKPGIPQWYVQQALNFQYGYTLELINGVPGYATIDPTAQIVVYAAIVEEANGVVLLKVAQSISGAPAPLTTAQLAAFTDYINQVAFAGTVIQVISLPSDKMQMQRTVYYNPEADPTVVLPAVIAAITAYLATGFQFNGIYVINKEIELILAIPGVVDYTADLTDARTDAQSSFTTVNRTYQALAGYMTIDPAYPLSSSITMVPADV